VSFTLSVGLGLLLAIASVVTMATPAQTPKTIPLNEVTDRALSKSQLTLPGGAPFHMKFSILETTNPKSERHAEVEEYWLSPEKYRRTIVSPAFSQTLIVNGSAVSETDTGDYYPYWLYQVVTAVFDPVPFAAQLADAKQEIPEPSGGERNRVCGDIRMRVDRITLCFSGTGLLESVFSKGYFAMFQQYESFAGKQVPRLIITQPEYKSQIEGGITLLEPLPQPDETLFAVTTPTPPADRIQVLRISEGAMRGLVIGSTDIAWPAVGGGPQTGGCGAFISADRNGNVREEFPEGCDSTGLEEPLHQALLKWKLKQPVVDGVPVQVTALLGFPFKVRVDPTPQPQLSDQEARSLATNQVEPVFPPGAKSGTKVEVSISVDGDGKFIGGGPVGNEDTNLYFLPGFNAIRHWKFSPYLKDGKPVPFQATIIFTVP
jgi:hypothetical protein